MPQYMTQPMQSGVKKKVMYYRKQTVPHPDHTETGKFTQAAIDTYCKDFNVQSDTVEKGAFKSGQGVPANGQLI